MKMEHRQSITGKVDDAKVEDQQRINGKRRKVKILYGAACALILLSIVCSAFSLIEYQSYSAIYHRDTALAREGLQHLKTGLALLEAVPHNPFNAPTVQNAQHEFAAALTVFHQLNNDLKSLPAISMSIPIYGSRLRAALHVLPLALELSQVGVIACSTLDLLIPRLHEPFNTQQPGLTMADLTVIEQNFRQIKTSINLITEQVNHLQPDDLQLDPRLGKLIATYHKDIPTLQVWLDVAETLLPVAPTLLGIGTPTHYLIEVLDSTELRPGGGFIGNYGIATFSGGRLISARITDTNLLDRPFGATSKSIPYPSAYTWFDLAPGGWSFRDSNLDADFPTAARYGEQTYMQEGGKIPVQGVIALTPTLIQHALEITGPIYIPEYQETVTAQNLIARIHYHQLGPGEQGSSLIPSPDGHSSQRKRFTELLAEHFLTHVRQLPSSALPKFFQLLLSSLRSKDFQLYLNSSIAENLLQHYHVDAAIQSPVGDSFFVVDANIAPDKANSFISNTLDDQVTIDTAGNAIHHTTIRYAWMMPGPVYGSPLYRDYVRVYVPLGSTLQIQEGWQPRGTSEQFGREVWAGFFTLSYGQTNTIILQWVSHSVARKDVHGWHYQYMIQKQAGAQWKIDLQVILPSHTAITNESGGLVTNNKRAAALSQFLSGDISLGIDYTG